MIYVSRSAARLRDLLHQTPANMDVIVDSDGCLVRFCRQAVAMPVRLADGTYRIPACTPMMVDAIDAQMLMDEADHISYVARRVAAHHADHPSQTHYSPHGLPIETECQHSSEDVIVSSEATPRDIQQILDRMQL